MNIREYLKSNILLFDGAYGSYYKELTKSNSEIEAANVSNQELVERITNEYLDAGCIAIKTNTFAANPSNYDDYKLLVENAIKIGKKATKGKDVFLFGNLGPSMDDEYLTIVKLMLANDISNYLFETLVSLNGIKEAVELIKVTNPLSFIIVSFSVNADGYSKDGEYYLDLIELANTIDGIDSIGLNCSTGPFHLLNNLKHFPLFKKPIYISPNASYPVVIKNRSVYINNIEYYCDEIIEIIKNGASIVGGCCGTTPAYLKRIKEQLPPKEKYSLQVLPNVLTKSTNPNKIMEKFDRGEKVIAVELDSPKNCDLTKFMEASKKLKMYGVDLMTIADNPLGNVRMSASLLACKLKRELDLEVMPHFTCRDRNINATKSLLLGLSAEEISNVLVITGDPIPNPSRSEVKAVYEFNSRKLAKYISNLNQNEFDNKFCVMAGLNLNALNFSIQLQFAKEKINNGVKVFLTQPVLSENAYLNLKLAYKELNAKILVGIMPVVSYKNAIYINNEIPGIQIDEKYLLAYKNLDRVASERLAIKLSKELISNCKNYSHGYYLMTPFYRVNIIKELVDYINENTFEDFA